MKVCEVCGIEIGGRDGENRCPFCEANGDRSAVARNQRRSRRERDDALRSLGLVKVRGALGGTYWE